MENRLLRVRFDDLDWGDQSFAIHSYIPLDHLRDSINRCGVLFPPWLLQTGQHRFAIVDGWKRLTAFRELSANACECLVFPETSDPARLLLWRIEAKLFGAVLNPAEKAQIITKLARIWPEEQILAEYFPRLQIPARPDAIGKWSRLAAQDKGFLEAVAAGRICERAALDLVDWEAEARGLAATLLNRLRCSASIQLEIIEQISELAMGQDQERLDILAGRNVQEILEDPQLNHRQMTQALRDLLRRLRFPRLWARQERFQEDLGRCHLPPRIRLQHPPAFEGAEWQLQVLFSNPEELGELLDIAVRFADSPTPGELMKPGSGSEPD
jgi:ParB family transcriptional regulator, chromosome partitioning protein